MIRDVLRVPDPRLKQIAPSDAADVQAVVQDLVDTMDSFPRCVGIAAPQIGEAVRVCVVDCTGHRRVPQPHGLLVLVEPVVAAASGADPDGVLDRAVEVFPRTSYG